MLRKVKTFLSKIKEKRIRKKGKLAERNFRKLTDLIEKFSSKGKCWHCKKICKNEGNLRFSTHFIRHQKLVEQYDHFDILKVPSPINAGEFYYVCRLKLPLSPLLKKYVKHMGYPYNYNILSESAHKYPLIIGCCENHLYRSLGKIVNKIIKLEKKIQREIVELSPFLMELRIENAIETLNRDNSAKKQKEFSDRFPMVGREAAKLFLLQLSPNTIKQIRDDEVELIFDMSKDAEHWNISSEDGNLNKKFLYSVSMSDLRKIDWKALCGYEVNLRSEKFAKFMDSFIRECIEHPYVYMCSDILEKQMTLYNLEKEISEISLEKIG